MKKIIALLLVLCFVIATLVACTGDTKTTEAPTNESTEAIGDVTLDSTNEYNQKELVKTIKPEEHDYSGETITMLIRNDENIIREFGSDTSTEEINEQILTRNDQVANDLNLVVVPEYIGSANYEEVKIVFPERIQQDVDSGMHTIDIVAHFAYCAGFVNVRERTANLLDEETFPYFDFSLPCWNQSIVKNSNINGISLVCAGDMTLSVFNYAFIMWHNKTLYDKIRDKDRDPKDIQDCVLSGEWTSDKLYRYSQVYRNTSANDDCDTYGIQLWGGYVDVCPHAWKLDIMLTNADGTHAFNAVGNQKAEESITLFRQMTSGQGNASIHINENKCNNDNCFIAGNIVFQADRISSSATATEKLRNMSDTYALIPFPKFDELQMGRELTDIEIKLGVEDLGYYTTAADAHSLLTVLDHSESSVPTKGHMVSAYLQHTAELSYADVRGYYFERVIRGKNLGLDDTDGTVTKSIRIFDMIIDNLQFEYWQLYSASLNNAVWLYRDTTIYTTNTLEQEYKAEEAQFQDALKSVEIWFGLIEE